MNEPNSSERFARFARTNDAADFGAVFDELAPELFAIAKRLTRDRAAAEDLAQATWLAAIEGAARFDAARALKPWLVGILVRQAQLDARRRRAVRSDEVVANVVDREDVGVEARDTREFVERRIAELAPSDRAVLAPYLFDDRRAAEIARELAEEPSTIHMRLRRALARLRLRVATGLGIAFVVSLLERRALAAMRANIERSIRASSTARTSSTLAASSSSSLALGGIVVSFKLMSLCAVALAAAAWFAWTKASNARGEALQALAEAPQVAGSQVTTQSIDAPKLEAAARVPSIPVATDSASNVVARSATPSEWRLVGRLVGFEGADGADAELVVHRDKSTVRAVAHAERDGRYSIDVSNLFAASADAVHELEVSVDHPRYLHASLRVLAESGVQVPMSSGAVRVEFPVDCPLALAAVVRGEAALPEGSTMDVESTLFPIGNLEANQASVDCVRGRTFALRAPNSGSFLLVVAGFDAQPVTMPVDARLGQVTDVGIVQLGVGAEIRGRVVDAHGVGVAGVSVYSRNRKFGPNLDGVNILRWNGTEAVRVVGCAPLTDDAGNFLIRGMAPGEHELSIEPHSTRHAIECDGLEKAPRAIVDAPAANALLHNPFAYVVLRLIAKASTPKQLSFTLRPLAGDSIRSGSSAWTPELPFISLPGESHVVDLIVDGYRPVQRTFEAPRAGEESIDVVELVPEERAKLVLKLKDDAGAALHSVGLGFFKPATLASNRAFIADQVRNLRSDDGSFVIDDVPSGEYRVRMRGNDAFQELTSYLEEQEFDVVLEPGKELTRELRLATFGRIRVQTTIASGRTRGDSAGEVSIRDARGEDVAFRVRHYIEDGGSEGGQQLRVGTNDILPNFAPGEYRVEIARPPREPAILQVTVTAGKTTEVTVDIGEP